VSARLVSQDLKRSIKGCFVFTRYVSLVYKLPYFSPVSDMYLFLLAFFRVELLKS